jgi:hypothetical protein
MHTAYHAHFAPPFRVLQRSPRRRAFVPYADAATLLRMNRLNSGFPLNRTAVFRALAAAVTLLAPACIHAQFGGEGKPTADTATIHTTCSVDGIQTIHDDYSNSTYTDKSANIKYILPIEGARARGEWNEVLRLSNMSIHVAPKCYYPYFSKGQAELYWCKLPDAKASFENFISIASADPKFASLINVSKDLLDSINSGDAAARCK